MAVEMSRREKASRAAWLAALEAKYDAWHDDRVAEDRAESAQIPVEFHPLWVARGLVPPPVPR